MKRLHEVALEIASSTLVGEAIGASQLDLLAVHKYEKDAIAGWRVPLADGQHVILALSKDFPFELPTAYWPESTKLPAHLHVNSNGDLCLDVSNDSFDPNDPEALIYEVLDSVNRLLIDKLEISDPKAATEYRDEFLGYWLRKINSFKPVYSLLSQINNVTAVFALKHASFTVVAHTAEECVTWANNFLGLGGKEKLSIEDTFKAICIKLDELPTPETFPNTGQDIAHLARQLSFEEQLNSLIDNDSECVITIFTAGDTPNHFFFGGYIYKPRLKKINGFRSVDKLPISILRSHKYHSQQLKVPNVYRVDPEWIHHRGGPRLSQSRKRVGIVGCGSLGAPVAIALAQSGMDLTLIDHDILQFENVARHPLGGEGLVERTKASGLAKHLHQRFPHINISVVTDKIQTVCRTNPEALFECDIIISTCANWVGELAMSAFARTNTQMPPVIFGWAEPHAIAGHALIVTDIGGCLNCQMDSPTEFANAVTSWDKSQLMKEPACGAYYQPYGAIDIAPIASMIARASMECLSGEVTHSELRTWIGSISLLNRLGGTLSSQWGHLDMDDSFREIKGTVNIHPECTLCN